MLPGQVPVLSRAKERGSRPIWSLSRSFSFRLSSRHQDPASRGHCPNHTQCLAHYQELSRR
jgi:hypothetical protein